jgi:sphingosine kinase
VYVNPVGGTGRAMQIFQSLVAPVLEQSQIEYEIVVTQHQAHATELVQELPLDTYDCIVAIGGDGLLSERAFVGSFCLLGMRSQY